MRVVLLFLLISFIGGPSIGQVFKYPYFYIKGTKEDKFDGMYGYYYKSKRTKNQELHIGLDTWKNNIVQQLKAQPIERQNLLIYVHGLWADNEVSFTHILEKMDENIYSKDINPFGVTISFKWQATLHYDTNVQITQSKGQIFADVYLDLIDELKCEFPDIRIAFLCHSMGNRVFETMLQTFRQQKTDPQINLLIMAAPDVHYNVFKENNSLEDICDFVDKVYVYHHENDTTLGFSSQLNGIPRLGKVSSVDTSAFYCNNIVFRNVLGVNDNEDLSGKITNHRYFYSSPTIRNEILEWLTIY